jgi:hypothetical protein
MLDFELNRNIEAKFAGAYDELISYIYPVVLTNRACRSQIPRKQEHGVQALAWLFLAGH